MKVSNVLVRGKRQPCVTWMTPSGEQVRRYFKDQTLADIFARDIRNEVRRYGEAWSAISPRDRAVLAECFYRAKEHGYTIVQACDRYETQPGAVAITVRQLIDQFIDAKKLKQLRPESLRLLKVTMKQFRGDREDRQASTVTSDEVTKFVSNPDWGTWRRRGAIIDLHNLFAYGVKAGLLARNPVDAVERPRGEDVRPEILTVEQCRKALDLAQKPEHKVILPWLVISMFAGLRQAEVARLRWEDVKDTYIDLGGPVTKNRQRRLPPIRPVLAEWLKLCRKPDKPVCPVKGLHKRLVKFREALGGMPRNALRHSWISYDVADRRSVDQTALDAGNSAQMIKRHYWHAVTPEAASAFFSLMP